MAKKVHTPEIYGSAATVAELAERTGLSKKQVKKCLDAFQELIKEKVAQGDKFRFLGFGTFEVKHRDAHTGHNPQTGETIQIAESNKLGFHSNVTF